MIIERARRKQRYSSLTNSFRCDKGISTLSFQSGNCPNNNKLSPSANSGLTLMELIIVLALMFIVIGMVYSFFDFINSASRRSGDQYQLQSNLGIAIDFITSELRNATEIEIVEVTFTPDADSQYIYIENMVLKHRNAGTITDKSEGVITSTTPFNILKADNDRYYITVDLQGDRRGEEYTLSTKILLNNISSVTGSMSGNAIRYKN